MGWNFAYNPSIWPPIIAILLLIGMAFFVWLRRRVPGAWPLLIWTVFGILTLIGAILKVTAIDPATKIMAYIFRDLWLLPAVTASACFVLEYAWPGRWLTRRNLTLLSLPCLMEILIVLTNNLQLMWRQLEIGPDGSVVTDLAPLGIVLTIYGYILFVINLFVLVWLFIRSPQLRWPAALILATQILVRGLFALHLLHLPVLAQPVMDVVTILLPGIVYMIALLGFHILTPISLARRAVIEQLHSGMLVLDLDGRVINLNPAAKKFLNTLNDGRLAGRLLGQPIQDLLPAYRSRLPDDDQAIEVDLEQEAGTEGRSYSLSTSTLKDWRGLAVARLLLLRDITEQKHLHTQFTEQQRALATMKERDQIARELHDELAQQLALINVQAQLINGLLEAGQTEQARAQLQVLAKVARETQVDVRGEISTLSLNIAPEEGFLGALQRFLEMFQQMYGVETKLALLGNHPPIPIAPTVEVQLLRIVQEVFTNIRKHAKARHVQVTLAREPECVVLMIADDGVGFDPENLPASGRTFGLRIMAERAEEIHGSVKLKSAPGQGTQIVVVAPANN